MHKAIHALLYQEVLTAPTALVFLAVRHLRLDLLWMRLMLPSTVQPAWRMSPPLVKGKRIPV
eukprot:1218060-Karenia_brevis.AAC.1